MSEGERSRFGRGPGAQLTQTVPLRAGRVLSAERMRECRCQGQCAGKACPEGTSRGLKVVGREGSWDP